MKPTGLEVLLVLFIIIGIPFIGIVVNIMRGPHNADDCDVEP